MNLEQLKLNQIGIIEEINCCNKTKRRLMDLGLVKGTNIKPILESPTKGIRAFLIRGTIMAIRDEDAKSVRILKNI